MKRKKVNRCKECNEPLKHIQTNQWMCHQSPSVCKSSTKVLFFSNEEEE